MEQVETSKTRTDTLELVTFHLGPALCGMDILRVQEINKLSDWTPVPHSPEYVEGILSLRGDIVTVIDMGKKLGMDPTVQSETSRNIVVHCDDEFIGLLVDNIGDVVTIHWDKVSPAPANVQGVQGKYMEGVLRTENDLIAILDVDLLLSELDKEPYKN